VVEGLQGVAAAAVQILTPEPPQLIILLVAQRYRALAVYLVFFLSPILLLPFLQLFAPHFYLSA
ncbi:MAG: hypothetical protein PHY20_15090, partial [Bacteroidales bacterium]|nr:hypothetical protein [Bacteroidales bacterium]